MHYGKTCYLARSRWFPHWLATREKGKAATEATLTAIFKQIETLRQAALPNTGAAK